MENGRIMNLMGSGSTNMQQRKRYIKENGLMDFKMEMDFTSVPNLAIMGSGIKVGWMVMECLHLVMEIDTKALFTKILLTVSVLTILPMETGMKANL